MASKEILQKLREDRLAREQARIQKLRELNLKKYGQGEAIRNNLQKSKSDASSAPKKISNIINNLKPDIPKRPATVSNGLSKTTDNIPSSNGIPKKAHYLNNLARKTDIKPSTNGDVKNNIKKDENKINRLVNKPINNNSVKENNNGNKIKSNLGTIPITKNKHSLSAIAAPKPFAPRKSCVPVLAERRESVFERLYKPKTTHNECTHNHEKPKLVQNATSLSQNKRHTISANKLPVRRSISAVHLKKINRSELKNCMHKWASIGEKINQIPLQNINEDDTIQEVVSAIKSERKVKFHTPSNPDDMRLKLQKWLEKHGKSVDSYHHLQCFGVQRSSDIPKLDFDENKENISLEHDSDNESYTELNNGLDKWRSPSCMDSVELNESNETTLTTALSPKVDELLLGAFNDLTSILRSGFSWEEGARWLRAIRDTYNNAQDTAAYWECRAALEERRGDMPASVQCWEQALAKGTEHSLAEANIDQLLVKFMQLKINPELNKTVDPKLLDAKNVFKSTLLRFAVQEAKTKQTLTPKTMVTPVRRSARLNHKETPLKLFNTIQQAIEAEQAEFRPNRAIAPTP
ncbi:unnamed protein product [Leptosia nina]|uniref:Uncharacterized protein n=1 Tax=Leptosia nina TaxID=320188 RepID=A0AAV1JD74_9NEOP